MILFWQIILKNQSILRNHVNLLNLLYLKKVHLSMNINISLYLHHLMLINSFFCLISFVEFHAYLLNWLNQITYNIIYILLKSCNRIVITILQNKL